MRVENLLQELWEGENRESLVKVYYKLSAVSWIKSEDLIELITFFLMMTIVASTVLYNWNLLREYNFNFVTHTHKTDKYMS